MRNTRPFTDPLVTDPLVGRRVRVTGQSYYGNRCIDKKGTVRAVYGPDNIAVDLDFVVNENSKNGYFYFKSSELEVIIQENIKTATAEEKGEKTMYKLTNYLNVAKVQFLNDDTPFRAIECANYTPDLAVSDLCVVQTAQHGMGLAEVVAIYDRPEKELRREIVDRVSTSDYDLRVEQRKQAAELKAKMQERAKQLQDIVLYQTLAKEDPEMAQMLQDFKALNQ